MDTSVESITIQSLDYKLDSKAGISKGKKRAYSRVMTEALLSEGMTDQNQVRFCHAFVATGIAPLVRLLNSEKGKDWKGIIQSLMKQTYFVKVVRMRLRFFMQLLSESIHDKVKNSQLIFSYSILNIVGMQSNSKGGFKLDSIPLFKECILNRWREGKLLSYVNDVKAAIQLKEFVVRCLEKDKNGSMKKHEKLTEFWSWIGKVSKQNQAVKHEKGVVIKSVDIAKPEGEKPAEVTKESIPAGEADQHEAPVVSLQKAIDLFEQRIVERDTEIKELKKQIDGLKDRIQKDRQAAIDEKEQLFHEMEREKQGFAEKSKEFQNTINSLQETLKQKADLIDKQDEQLKERKQLLQDNDIRFENHYKQQMMALGNKLKQSFSDLRDSINDVSPDDKEFLELPLQDIIKILEKEGVKI